MTTNLTFKILHWYHNQSARKTMKILNHNIFKTKKNIPNLCTSRPWHIN